MPDPQKSSVHILAKVDLKKGTGRFLYVVPSTCMVGLGADGADAGPHGDGSGFVIVVEDGGGVELARLAPAIFVNADSDDRSTGLIDQSMPHITGMKRLVLLHDGENVATFEAGAEQPAETDGANAGLNLGPLPSGSSKRPMSLGMPVSAEPGVSYTVQVRPEGTAAWHTIAVGRDTPEVTLDRNQFPGAARATVRVLRSTGFDDRIVTEESISLADEDGGAMTQPAGTAQ